MHIAWPDSNRINLIELSQGDFWPRHPNHKWASVWFKASASSPDKTALKADYEYHKLLLEQFCFCSFIDYFVFRQHPWFKRHRELHPINSSWGVWRLCSNLRELSLLTLGASDTPTQLPLYETETDISGLAPGLGETVRNLCELSYQALEALSSSKDTQTLERVLDQLGDQLQAEGLAGWIACRCALTLLEAMQELRRHFFEEVKYIGGGEAIRYVARRIAPATRISSRFSRLEGWKRLRLQLAPFYQGAYWLGKGKKFNPNRVISLGLANVPPSQINVGGSFASVADLLAGHIRGDANNLSADVESVISHVPIPRSWFRPLLERKDTPLEAVLSRIAENHIFAGPSRPLSASAMQKLCALARRSSTPAVLSGILAVLLESNFWAFIDDDTLGKVIEADATQADVASHLFRETGLPSKENPRLLNLAKLIVAGKIEVSRTMGVAAAKYSAKNISLKLEPLGAIFEKRRGGKGIQ